MLTFTKSASRNEGGIKSASRFADFYQICKQKWGEWVNLQAAFLNLTKYSSRFADFYQICQQKWGEQVNIPADLLNFIKSANRNGGLILPADLLTVTKPASRNGGGYFCHRFTDLQPIWEQICWLSPHLPADLLIFTKFATRNEEGDKSASRFASFHQICQQIWGVNSASRFTDCWQIYQQTTANRNVWASFCQQIYWPLANLPADLLTFTKSAGSFLPAEMGGIFASRFTDCQQICQPQIFWLSRNLPTEMGVYLLADLLTVTKSTSRFADLHQICQKKWEGVNFLADLLTVTKPASRNGKVFLPADLLSANLPADFLTFTKFTSRNSRRG